MSKFSTEQFGKELNYSLAKSTLEELVENGLILPKDYKKLSTIFAKKYGSILSSLYL